MIKKVALIGTGNVASWLAYRLQQTDISLVQVYSRTPAHAADFAERFHTQAISNLQELTRDCDLYLFAVSDNIYPELLKQVPFRMRLAAHTGGAVSQHIFKDYAENYGTLYPYQSISSHLDFQNLKVPLCVEGNNERSTETLLRFAAKVSPITERIDEKQRMILHIAAVFANNFSNALFDISHKILYKNNIDWKIILPIIENTAQKVTTSTPEEAQTGPAKRQDSQTINRHLQLLEDAEQKEIYQILTQYIIKNIS